MTDTTWGRVAPPPDGAPADAAPDRTTEAFELADSSRPGLWPGDRGSLDAPSRRALLALLRGPYLSADRHGDLWKALLRDTDAIVARLNDVYCDLVVDIDVGVAFVRNVELPDGGAPRAVRTAPLTFLDTAMLLVLRQHFLASDGADRVIVGKDEVAEQLDVYRGAMGRDESDFARRVNASWTNMDKHGFTQRTDVEGRVEISPLLRIIVGPEQVAAVRASYERMAAGGGPAETEVDREGDPRPGGASSEDAGGGVDVSEIEEAS